jgi:hypothetical protein
MALHLSRMIIGARNLWLTLVTSNKNSLRRKIFDVFGAVEIPTVTTKVPSLFSEFRFFERFRFVRSDALRLGPLL